MSKVEYDLMRIKAKGDLTEQFEEMEGTPVF